MKKIDLHFIKKHKKTIIQAGTIILIAIILLIVIKNPKEKEEVVPVVNEEAGTLEALVEEFGRKHALVSLLSDKAVVTKAISGHYSYYASPKIIAEWQKDPENAPGRLTSSPWPDRIEVDSVIKNEDGSYAVEGRLIEVTSDTKDKDGIFAEYPVTITLEDFSGRWLITKYEKKMIEPAETEITKELDE